MQFKRRDGLLSAVFSILTCGLYGIYYWYRYGEDVNVICKDDGKETMNYIVAWILSIVTCGIYGMYWTYTMASRLDTASKKYNVNVESPVFFTLFMNIPFLSYFYSCDVMNKFQEKYEEMYPNGRGGYGNNGYGNNGYANNTYGGNVPPVTPNGGGNGQSLGAQIGSQLKSAVQDMGNGIKNSAQSAMPTCKNCGSIVPPGKNYCKNCGFPINGPEPKNPTPKNPMQDGGQTVNSQATKDTIPKAETPLTNPTAGEVKPNPSVMDSVPLQKTVSDKNIQEEKALEEQIIRDMKVQNFESPVGGAAPKKCPKCNNPVKPGDRFCIHCGSKID